jgi:hypothetical protein
MKRNEAPQYYIYRGFERKDTGFYIKLIIVTELTDAIIEQVVKGRFILYMSNMYHPLFFMAFM